MYLVYQVIYKMIVTKDPDNKYFDYIYPWGETLAYIVCSIKASYRQTLVVAPG